MYTYSELPNQPSREFVDVCKLNYLIENLYLVHYNTFWLHDTCNLYKETHFYNTNEQTTSL